MKTFIALSALVAIAQAQDLTSLVNSLPDCGKLCVNNMLGLAGSLGCSSNTDIPCLCSKPDFGYGVRDCSAAVCSAADAAKTVQVGTQICQQFAAAAASSAGSSASSAASSLASSASSVASAASASASSISSGASSTGSSVSSSITDSVNSQIGSVAAGAIGTATTSDASMTKLIVTYTSGSSTLETTVSLPSGYQMTGSSMVASTSGIAGAIGTATRTTNGMTQQVVTFTSGGSTMESTITMASSSSGSGSSSGMSTSTARPSSSSSGSGAFQTQAPIAAAVGLLGLIAAL